MEMVDEPHEHRAVAMIGVFLQHKSMEQTQGYLVRGRRFAALDLGRLRADWVSAVRNWLARKDQAGEQMLDDLTAELHLRGSTPPYDSVKKELVSGIAGIKGSAQNELWSEFAREITEFMRTKPNCIH
jgi:hypothetical protein